jgi:high affinity Mn2+ porin
MVFAGERHSSGDAASSLWPTTDLGFYRDFFIVTVQGLQAGYNYMLPNRIVVGAEADVTFPGVPNNAGVSIGGISNLTSPTLGAVTFSETVLTSGTVRGRIGYAPGSWLFYATGGFTWTYDRQTLTQFAIGASEQPFLWRLGFAAGAGIEVPIAPHWTARLEYLFTDYGNSGTTFFAGAQRIDSNFALQELRAGGLRDQEYLRLKVLTCMLPAL